MGRAVSLSTVLRTRQAHCAGLLRPRAGVLVLPPCLGFPLDFKNYVWSQSGKLGASCVKTLWGETWTRVTPVSWDASCGVEACREGGKKMCFGVGIRLLIPAFGCQRDAGG